MMSLQESLRRAKEDETAATQAWARQEIARAKRENDDFLRQRRGKVALHEQEQYQALSAVMEKGVREVLSQDIPTYLKRATITRLIRMAAEERARWEKRP